MPPNTAKIENGLVLLIRVWKIDLQRVYELSEFTSCLLMSSGKNKCFITEYKLMLYVQVNTFSVMSGCKQWGWSVLLKGRTQCLRWGSNQRSLDVKSSVLRYSFDSRRWMGFSYWSCMRKSHVQLFRGAIDLIVALSHHLLTYFV